MFYSTISERPLKGRSLRTVGFFLEYDNKGFRLVATVHGYGGTRTTRCEVTDRWNMTHIRFLSSCFREGKLGAPVG